MDYSYAVVLWFMMHGEIPLDDVPIKNIFRAADSGTALRPRLDRITFAPLKDLIERTWNDDPRLRGSADDIVATLRSMRLPCGGGSTSPTSLSLSLSPRTAPNSHLSRSHSLRAMHERLM